MIIVKASKDSEAGVMPSEKLLTQVASRDEAIAWVKRCPNPDFRRN